VNRVWLGATVTDDAHPLPQRAPMAEVFTTRLPVVQTADAPPAEQHAVTVVDRHDRAPGPLFDPDRVAMVEDYTAAPAGSTAAALDELPVDVDAVLEVESAAAPSRNGDAWFAPAVPAAALAAGTPVPPAGLLVDAADVLHAAGYVDVARFVDAWAGVGPDER
jgi:hypothetical protein